jgi:hypothetical protein
MKITLKAVLVGLIVGGGVSFAFGMLDSAIFARGGQPFDWPMRVGVGTALGAVALFITAALGGNKQVRLASPAEDKRAKEFAPDAGRGVVYVFRDAFVGKLVGIDLLVDGRPAAQTRGETFVRLELAPGAHHVSSMHGAGGPPADLPVSVAAGSIGYVEQGVRMGAVEAKVTLTVKGEAESQKRIRKCRLLAPTAGA